MIQHGPNISGEYTTFRLWAPGADKVDLVAGQHIPLQRQSDGWHEIRLTGIVPGTRYKFAIDDRIEVPDPASHFQPDDVADASEVIDHSAFAWTTQDWKGRPWREAIFLEAHVGTFSPEGTYAAMIDKLDHLVETGITALELMPLADFSGRRNWGYDGVLLYAPDSRYGRPDDLKRLVDEAHRRGLMMFLDVVYNHFGPEGNYLGEYAPRFFSAANTPWGSAIDYSQPAVRSFAIENALHWLRDYRFDGLRLDAVHAITEPGNPSVLKELSERVGELARATGRHIHLVLENDDNRASLLAPQPDPPAGLYRAQWNDDYHHAWHALLTSEHHAYYRDYAENPIEKIARSLASGFVFQGEPSPFRQGNPRGEASSRLSPLAFVNFLQNHDQIGNRALGERLEALTAGQKIEAALSVLLLAPPIPLLFMGEEWGATTPFPFFCDFSGDLAEAVRQGRRKEFKESYASGENIPDALDEKTFRSATLNWSLNEEQRSRLALVRRLLRIRQDEILPRLDMAAPGEATIDNGVIVVAWPIGNHTLRLTANLTDARLSVERARGRVLWGHAETILDPWSVHWQLDG